MPEPTGFCWACGRQLPLGRLLLWCHAKCQRRYEREEAANEKRVIRKGKREGYGIGGSTH